MKLLLRILRYGIVITGVVAFLWLLGLEVFVTKVSINQQRAELDQLEKTDAIVVLTGGSERVDVGLDLLNAGKADQLLISGVHQGTSLNALIAHHPIDGKFKTCCITLGKIAESTQGNAEEARSWMINHNFHSLRLVTANYHMPRSLILFRDAMPDATIIPHPVEPDSVKLEGWWLHPGTASLLVTEYMKLLSVLIKKWLS